MTGAAPFRVGRWLPSDQQVLERWLDDLIAKTDARGDVPLFPVVEEFRQLIERDPEISGDPAALMAEKMMRWHVGVRRPGRHAARPEDGDEPPAGPESANAPAACGTKHRPVSTGLSPRPCCRYSVTSRTWAALKAPTAIKVRWPGRCRGP